MHEIFLGRYPFKDKVEAQSIIWKVSKGHVATVDASDFPLMFKVRSIHLSTVSLDFSVPGTYDTSASLQPPVYPLCPVRVSNIMAGKCLKIVSNIYSIIIAILKFAIPNNICS